MSRKNTLESRRNMPPAEPYTPEEKRQFKQALRAYKDAIKSGEWKKIPYNQFLDLVKERPDPTLDKDRPVCPKCDSKKVEIQQGVSTCLGWSEDSVDPNHHWDSCECKECNYAWNMEWQGVRETQTYNVWYTAKTIESNRTPKLIRGIPSCYESYVYTCRHCGGNVERNTFNKGTRDNAGVVIYRDGKKSVDYVFQCNNCHAEVNNGQFDYYLFSSPHEPQKPWHMKHIRWRIYESVGPAIINDYAIQKIEVSE